MLASKIAVEGATLSTTLAERSGQRLKLDDSVERKYLDHGNHILTAICSDIRLVKRDL